MAVSAHIVTLLVQAKAATFGDRPLPLPDDMRARLAEEAETAFDASYEEGAGVTQAEELLIYATFAALAHPYSPQALAALRAAVALIEDLRKGEREEAAARAEADTSWERKAGLMG